MNHCLKFDNEATAIAAMPQYRSDDQWTTASHTHALDPIGTLYAPTGAKTPEGDDVMAAIDGWHANLIVGELPANLEEYVLIPQSPQRVWA